jgi:signal transduction histidine kinase
MGSALVDGLFGVAALSGVVLCAFGLYCYRSWDEPGVTPFAAFTILLGICGIAGSAAAIASGGSGTASEPPFWGNLTVLLWGMSTVPWLVFSLQYTGTYTRLRRRTIALISAPLVFLVPVTVFNGQSWVADSVLVQIIGTFAFVHTLFLVIIGVYLVLRTTHEYGHLSLVQGASLGIAGFGTFLAVNTASILTGEVGMEAASGAYATGFAVPAGLIALTIFRYDMFESTPAAGTIGEQAIARETDDLVFVVDQSERIIKLNPKVAETFELSRTETLGEPIETVLDCSLDELRQMDTYELRTGVSRRQFDPTVSQFTDQHGRQLGSLVSLHDVTERELRKQRLEVLNRVLRHNLRNTVDVIKSNAEALTEETYADRPTDEHADTIIDSADGLAHLGQKARLIDRFVSRSVRDTERDLTAVVSDLIEDVCNAKTNGTGPDVTVEFERPESAPLLTDWEALTAALESAIENAIEHAEDTVSITVTEYTTGYRITVTDDGPGIPESELESLDTGRETPLQHGSGLGLWQIKWGIKKLNGTVSFQTDSGTTVEMTVPDQSAS